MQEIRNFFLLVLIISSIKVLNATPSRAYKVPTVWHIENQTLNQQHVSCRTYYGGWSSWSVREVHFDIPSQGRATHQFPDHNDGLGMIQRNWSCASNGTSNPLILDDSQTFKTKGYPDSTITIPTLQQKFPNQADTQQIDNNLAHHYCPDVQSIQRLNECTSSRCSWERYGYGGWRGTLMPPVSQEDLADFRFVGVDADQSFENILGCVYTSKNDKKNLILIHHQKEIPGQFPKFSYSPVSTNDFQRQAGYIQQCLSEDRFQCPLGLR